MEAAALSLFNFLSFLFRKSFGAFFCFLGWGGGGTLTFHFFFWSPLKPFLFPRLRRRQHSRRHSSSHQKSSSANKALHIFRSLSSLSFYLYIFFFFFKPQKEIQMHPSEVFICHQGVAYFSFIYHTPWNSRIFFSFHLFLETYRMCLCVLVCLCVCLWFCICKTPFTLSLFHLSFYIFPSQTNLVVWSFHIELMSMAFPSGFMADITFYWILSCMKRLFGFDLKKKSI